MEYTDFSTIISIGIALNVALQFDWSGQILRTIGLQLNHEIDLLEFDTKNVRSLSSLYHERKEFPQNTDWAEVDRAITEEIQQTRIALAKMIRRIRFVQHCVSIPLIAVLLVAMWFITFYPDANVALSWENPLKLLIPIGCYVIPLSAPILGTVIARLADKALDNKIRIISTFVQNQN